MLMDQVMLAVPTRGQIGWATVTRLEEIRDLSPGLRPIVYQPGNLSVALTRNKIVRRFLETDCDVLAMVDDDVVPPPHFLDIREHLMDGFGMVSIPHPMPTPTGDRLVFTVFDDDGDGLRAAPLQQGLNECEATATGAVVISREALDAVGEDPFRIAHDPTADVTSDDFLFCRDLRAAGFKVGYFWDGWYCDHHSTVGLAPLIESTILVGG
jgi:hypothetical protein